MLLIGLAGRKGSGKSTIAEYLHAKHHMVEIGFADPLKMMVAQLFDIPMRCLMEPSLKEAGLPEWGLTPRKIMQQFGVNVRNIHPDVWVRFAERVIRHVMDPKRYYQIDKWEGVVISDVRFPNEVDMIHRNDGKVIRIVPRGPWPPQENDEHESERWETLGYDYELGNGLDEMTVTIQDLERIFNDIKENQPD